MAEAVATSYRREVQTSQCYKREVKKKKKQKKKKRGARWSHGSPHIERSQGGFTLSQGAQGEATGARAKNRSTQAQP